MLGRLNKLFFLIAAICFLTWLSSAKPFKTGASTSVFDYLFPADTPRYEPTDSRGNPMTSPDDDPPALMPKPSNYSMDVTLDDSLNYIVEERVGDHYYSDPQYMSFDEYRKYRMEQSVNDYFREQSTNLDAEAEGSSRRLVPKIALPPGAFDRIFGGHYVDIRPTGSVTLDFAARFQRIDNPAIPVRQQRTGGFDFDQNINMSVSGKVGEKLTMNANWATNASFSFQNNFKIDYNSFEQDILQQIEVGNITFPSQNSLINGSNELFGVKTRMRFGRLDVTSVFSSQRGRTETLRISGGGGGQVRDFEIRVDEYEMNRHFFIGHFFRDKYDNALKSLPFVNSGVQITRIEVYVTNSNANTQTLRNIVALTDLGESSPYNPTNPNIGPGTSNPAARNDANFLYTSIRNDNQVRDADNTINRLQSGYNLQNGTDFTLLRGARKLNENEFIYQPELGYISLLSPLQNDEMVGVAFEYRYNGQVYTVGELTETYQQFEDDEVIIMKMLKPAAIKTNLPTWDLMMKNIYSLNTSSLNGENFQLKVIYKDDATGVDNPTLDVGQNVKNQQLVTLLGADQLNINSDPITDGNFDFLEGVTVQPDNGRIVFPTVEPFGATLESKFNAVTEGQLINKYVFDELYSGTQSDAMQITSKTKFFLKGSYRSSASTEIFLPGINIAEGSVSIKAGSATLSEGIDYTVDYNLGRVRILDDGVLSSANDIIITYERADIFNFRQKTLVGARLDYTISENLKFGGDIRHLTEQPVITRTAIMDEPVKNTVFGLDMKWKTESRLVTKAVDALPFIQTKAPSTINVNAEVASLLRGSPKRIGKGGVAYIDDFEGAENVFDLTINPTRWQIASTPKRFPESDSTSLAYTSRRAKLSWYTIDNVFYRGNPPDGFSQDDPELDYHYVRQINPQEIFPNFSPQVIQTNEPTLDLAYYPSERGPYNYNTNLNNDGTLANAPQSNWGGIQRGITFDTDFDNANISFIEFWVMDPFIVDQDGNGDNLVGGVPASTNPGGKMYINIGNISEDVIKDGRHGFENGIPANDEEFADNVETTTWGRVTNQQFLTAAFDSDPNARDKQDVGLDGLANADERNFFSSYISAVPPAAQSIVNADPSADDFQYYLGDNFASKDLLVRYKQFYGLENNSPVNEGGAEFTPASTTTPNNEDLNNDNTISSLEEYFEYEIPFFPGMNVANNRYIVDQHTVNGGTNGNPTGDDVTWYQFRIPIREPDSVVGNVDIKTVRFVRTYLTDFPQPVVLRLARFQFVASQWRIVQEDLREEAFGVLPEPHDPSFTIGNVNIEENGGSNGGSTPYVLPPGVIRDQDNLSQNNRQLNEQSLKLCAENLEDGDARGVFKDFRVNLLHYKNIAMYVHADTEDPSTLDGETELFMRLGTDKTENYYEVAVPLELTPLGTTNPGLIWPDNNNLDIVLQDFPDLKVRRDEQGINIQMAYKETINGKIYTVRGRPDLSSVINIVIGIRNPETPDKAPKSVCVWVNELRVHNFKNTPNDGFPSSAANASVDMQLADLGTVSMSGTYTSVGYGPLAERISQRTLETRAVYGISSNIALDRFFGEKSSVKLPLHVDYSKDVRDPKYDPLDPDVELERSAESKISDEDKQKEYIKQVRDITTAKSINLTNVRKVKTGGGKATPLDISNFSVTAAYSEVERNSALIESYEKKTYKGALAYNYSSQAKPFEPFKNAKFLDNPYLQLIKDFNIGYLPSNVSCRADLDRLFIREQIQGTKDTPEGKQLTTEGYLPTWQKRFTLNRSYGVKWDLSKNLTYDYNANVNALIDEPDGDIDTKAEKDVIWNNLKDFGRNKLFTQTSQLNYKVPFDKFPLTNWLDVTANYTADYNWTAGALGIADTLGNNLSNARSRSLNGRVNLTKLYNKVKFLKDINEPQRKRPDSRRGMRAPQKPAEGEKEGEEGEDEEEKEKKELKGLKSVFKVLMALQTVNFNVSVDETTFLPGFMPTAKYFGLDDGFNAPGLPFVMGSQDPSIRFTAAEKGWLSNSSALNQAFTQTRSVNYRLNTSIEPFNNFRIQLDMNKSTSSNYQELYRNVDSLGGFVSQAPVRTGSFTMSFIAIKTAFKPDNDNNVSPVFEAFEDNRATIQSRLYGANNGAGFYDKNSQDVLIPSFVAAYTGKDAKDVSLSPFPSIPLPNWRLTYSGLSRIAPFKKWFSSVSINHSYSSTYTVGSFTSSLVYNDPSILGLNNNLNQYPLATQPNALDSLPLYSPVYVMNLVVIQERFSPLIGVTARTKSGMDFSVNFEKTRSVTLNMSNAQVTEVLSNNIVLRFGFNKKGFKVPFFKARGGAIILDNDLNFRVDLSIRDTRTVQRGLDEGNTVTAGNLNFQLRPNVSYQINERLNMQLFFERTINEPRVSSSFRRTSTAVGVQVRFTL